MKKIIIKRLLLGFPLGIAIGTTISIIISLIFANGYYSPCAPSFIEKTGSEINAVILQTILCGAVGSSFSASSVIWEIEKWSIAKQTGIYFTITAIVMLPTAYILNWMEASISGFFSYFAIFIIIFVVFWIISYLIYKANITKINSQIKKM